MVPHVMKQRVVSTLASLAGVIGVETQTVMMNIPADPGMPDSTERTIPQVQPTTLLVHCVCDWWLWLGPGTVHCLLAASNGFVVLRVLARTLQNDMLWWVAFASALPWMACMSLIFGCWSTIYLIYIRSPCFKDGGAGLCIPRLPHNITWRHAVFCDLCIIACLCVLA